MRHKHVELGAVQFDDSFVSALPGDSSTVNIPREVRHACYTWVTPTPVQNPQLLAWSEDTGRLLGIKRPKSLNSPDVEALAGNRLFPTMKPYASRYGGHQFGYWAGQLGDGRAITLGEIVNYRQQRWELQLKGAGLTPYSRTADGRAVLRSSVREFLCSEAMHYLGVPTTRALSLVTTGEEVIRDMFYDGHPQAEPGAVVCRVAPSFIRFGHFELLAACGETEALMNLANYVIRHHFPELGYPGPECYAAWFEEVCRRTAIMVVHWMRVGFVHGVMNTDNMSILGLTIDYGPYGWLEGFDPGWTPNTTDAQGRRYCYGRQPGIALWNLECLGWALSSLVKDKNRIAQALEVYQDVFKQEYGQMLARKLGVKALVQDDSLIEDLFVLFGRSEVDMTLFFRCLSNMPIVPNADGVVENKPLFPLKEAFYTYEVLNDEDHKVWANWLRCYTARVLHEAVDPDKRLRHMKAINPKYVLRNYLAQQAIEAAEQGDPSLIGRLLKVLQKPYDEQPEYQDYAKKRPEWARHKPGCAALSCSS